MKLQTSTLLYCQGAGLEYGYDVDTQCPQLTHVTWPRGGALCATPHLWGSCELDAERDISCPSCCDLLRGATEQLLNPEGTGRGAGRLEEKAWPQLGRLARELRKLEAVAAAAEELVWAIENPLQAAEEAEVRDGDGPLMPGDTATSLFVRRLKAALNAWAPAL